MNEQLEQIRLAINETDSQLSRLIAQRMDLVAQVAAIKEKEGLPIYDPQREAVVLDRISTGVEQEKAPYLRRIYQCMMDASKDYEKTLMCPSESHRKPEADPLPSAPKIACQGVSGAFSGEAAQRMFPEGEYIFVPAWEDAFQKVVNDECDFAVLPVENSLVGSVSPVYDLLIKYRLTIVRACCLPVDQNLLGLPDAKPETITEIYSHPQGLAQCQEFCALLPQARTIPMGNTASAAKMVAALKDNRKAAIASRYCAELYGLKILAENIQTAENNTTRFVAVSKKRYSSPHANKISLVFSQPHQPGALNRILSRFSQHALNLTKIESRPLPDKPFEYDFYLDFSGNTQSSRIRLLMEQLYTELPSFTYLGNYEEI